jgi:hypothetical protein
MFLELDHTVSNISRDSLGRVIPFLFRLLGRVIDPTGVVAFPFSSTE